MSMSTEDESIDALFSTYNNDHGGDNDSFEANNASEDALLEQMMQFHKPSEQQEEEGERTKSTKLCARQGLGRSCRKPKTPVEQTGQTGESKPKFANAFIQIAQSKKGGSTRVFQMYSRDGTLRPLCGLEMFANRVVEFHALTVTKKDQEVDIEVGLRCLYVAGTHNVRSKGDKGVIVRLVRVLSSFGQVGTGIKVVIVDDHSGRVHTLPYSRKRLTFETRTLVGKVELGELEISTNLFFLSSSNPFNLKPKVQPEADDDDGDETKNARRMEETKNADENDGDDNGGSYFSGIPAPPPSLALTRHRLQQQQQEAKQHLATQEQLKTQLTTQLTKKLTQELRQ